MHTDWRERFLRGGDDDDLPIVDAHHHLFDLAHNPHPWLQGQRVPFRYGDYAAICRDFSVEDFRRCWGRHRVVASVLMEGEWDPRDPLGEARWASAVADREGLPDAIAAQAWLDREDLAEVLQALAALPRVRSVRHKPRSVPRAQHHAGYDAPGSMRCPRWRDGYARLERHGLHFELQAPWWHLDEAVALARDFPRTLIVLNHAGLPAERDAASLAAWAAAMGRLATCDNVVVKISGLGVPGRAWTVALQQPVVHTLIDAFGVQRCLFASNFPVDSLVVDYDTLFTGFKQITRTLPPADRLALFHDNAVRVYRLA